MYAEHHKSQIKTATCLCHHVEVIVHVIMTKIVSLMTEAAVGLSDFCCMLSLITSHDMT